MFLIEQLWAGIVWIANAIAGEQGFVIQLVVYVSMILFERGCANRLPISSTAA
jgi:hypothetical protein